MHRSDDYKTDVDLNTVRRQMCCGLCAVEKVYKPLPQTVISGIGFHPLFSSQSTTPSSSTSSSFHVVLASDSAALIAVQGYVSATLYGTYDLLYEPDFFNNGADDGGKNLYIHLSILSSQVRQLRTGRGQEHLSRRHNVFLSTGAHDADYEPDKGSRPSSSVKLYVYCLSRPS
ncbi:hypothetical protein EXIGLDRAFT_771056 [Exidia glandulosa HHB12029]|uniref:Uncharacterized protein n=1 Tax=Exidia glandulosa HHB12029 TaxID=1314781 RepID=A0A165GA46_EXIGL|nr:hypothetical protein EXIGLDRAFT_771056 [Exidia glandulosa HHB12029]